MKYTFYEKNVLIKSILNKPESVNRDQHTLCHCKFVSQNENISKTVTTSAPKVDLTGTEKSNSFKERQPDKNKKEIKQIQNVQDTPDEYENISAEATVGSSQQETTETQTVTLVEEKYHRNGLSRNENRNEKRVVLLGDSIIKNINVYELSNQVEKGKIYVKSYSGSKIGCVEDHAKPTSRKDSDHIILHVGMNDLPTRKNLDETAKSIVQLAPALKTKSCDVFISSITARSDQYRKNAIEVNKKLCLEINLYLIDHGNIINTRHVNGSKLHLNKKGIRVLFSNFKEAISNIATTVTISITQFL